MGEKAIGPEGFRAYRNSVRTAFPNFHNEVVDLVVTGNRAAVRLRCTGRHEGDVLGLPATGASVAYEAAGFLRAEHDRLAEAWVLGDLDSLRRQCGGP